LTPWIAGVDGRVKRATTIVPVWILGVSTVSVIDMGVGQDITDSDKEIVGVV